MIDVAAILLSVAAKKAIEQGITLFKGNKKALQKSFERAFQTTVQWYENRYNDDYGTRNNRFFDHQAAANEFAKLLFLHREPDIHLIANMEFEKGKTTPVEIV